MVHANKADGAENPKATVAETPLCPPAHGAHNEERRVVQVSTLQELALGNYRGTVSVGELKQMGDTGIGTFDRLDGELVMAHGTVFQAGADGTVVVVGDTQTVPFADVAFFEADGSCTLRDIESIEDLESQLDTLARQDDQNYLYVALVEGDFSHVNMRSERAQCEPFDPLPLVLERDQTVFDRRELDGTLVCLYCPKRLEELNSVGWHMHFVSPNHNVGGHVLELAIRRATASWCRIGHLELVEPHL